MDCFSEVRDAHGCCVVLVVLLFVCFAFSFVLLRSYVPYYNFLIGEGFETCRPKREFGTREEDRETSAIQYTYVRIFEISIVKIRQYFSSYL